MEKTKAPLFETSPDRLVDEAERLALTSVSRATWVRWENEGLVPKRHKIGPSRVAWRLSEIQRWIDERCAKQTDAA